MASDCSLLNPLTFGTAVPLSTISFPRRKCWNSASNDGSLRNTRGKHSSDREQDHVLKLNSSGDELLLMFVPGQALQVDSGEQHSKRDVIMMQHSLSDSVKRHLNRKPSA